MNPLEKYLGDTYDLVDTLKNSGQSFVAVVYDKRVKRLCVMKRREKNSLPIYRALKDLDSPHVPKIFRLIERAENLIVIEEHVDGLTLEEFFAYRGVDENLAEKILLQLCDALKILHTKNIIHRDLKPSNIMLTEKNFVKLVDLGIARIFKPESAADTQLLGTRGYAPPEQFGLFDFGQTDARSDIFSLGVTIKNLLGEKYGGRLKKILDKCTELDPKNRFQSVDEIRAAVERRKKFLIARKIFAAAAVGFAIFFFPRTTNFISPPEEKVSEEKISAPVEKISQPEKNSAPEEKVEPEKIFDASSIQIPSLPQNSPPEINLPAPAPPQTNRPQPPQEKSSGKVELKIFLNGSLTDKHHMVYVRGWKNWSRDEYKQILFPNGWHARLRVENHSGKDLIRPRLEVNFGQDKKKFDVPDILNGQSFDLEIPLGGKVASTEKGNGYLQIILETKDGAKNFLNKTFFLVE